MLQFRRFTNYVHHRKYKNYRFGHNVHYFFLPLVTALLVPRKFESLEGFWENPEKAHACSLWDYFDYIHTKMFYIPPFHQDHRGFKVIQGIHKGYGNRMRNIFHMINVVLTTFTSSFCLSGLHTPQETLDIWEGDDFALVHAWQSGLKYHLIWLLCPVFG